MPPRLSTIPRPRRPDRLLGPQTNPLLYQGGNILKSVSVYVDFWGPEWQDPSQASVQAYIDGFFTDIGGSPWAATMDQYCSGVAMNASSCPPGSNFIQNPSGQLKGHYVDTNPVPAIPTAADISNEAKAAAAHFGSPSDALFMVYTPSGKSQSGFQTTFCAYHSWVSVGPQFIPFGYMPYQPDAGSVCAANLVDGPLDGFSIVGGHEYAEAVTDPFPTTTPGISAWQDPTMPVGGPEIGDKCAWNPTPINENMSGHSWPVQALFSNQALAKSQPPCVFGGAGTPTGVSASAGNAQATVRWNPPSIDGGSPITGYRITPYIALTAQSPTSAGPVTSFMVTGLTNGTTYTFTVAALNAYGAGPESSQSNAVTPATTPGQPTGVSASAGDLQATVTWTAPADSGGGAITSYTINCSPPCQPAMVGGSTLTVTITGLPVNMAITFTVTAANMVGAGLPSSPSNPVMLRPAEGQAPSQGAPARSGARPAPPNPSPPHRTFV
jgi:hypothetical protein